MANYPSSIRRIRKSERARVRNKHSQTRMKTAIKSVLAASDKEEAEKNFRKTTALLDKLASKGVIHKNKAANQKSRLAIHVNNL